jgi:hypothetical protein
MSRGFHEYTPNRHGRDVYFLKTAIPSHTLGLGLEDREQFCESLSLTI